MIRTVESRCAELCQSLAKCRREKNNTREMTYGSERHSLKNSPSCSRDVWLGQWPEIFWWGLWGGEEKKKKHSVNAGCFPCESLSSVSLSLSKNGKTCLMPRRDWWTHPRQKELDSLAEGRRVLRWLSPDTLTIFESKGAWALSRLTQLPARVMRRGSEGDSRQAPVSALLRNTELLMNIPKSRIWAAVDRLINTGGWLLMGQHFATKRCHC